MGGEVNKELRLNEESVGFASGRGLETSMVRKCVASVGICAEQ